MDGSACLDIMRSVLDKKADMRFRVMGSSMSPFIRDGDIITLSRLPEGRISLGHSIAYTRPCGKKLIIHRLVGRRKNSHEWYIIKGDNAYEADCPVSRTDMLAYVKKVERNGKRISFGTGPERKAIAFLSKWNILCSLFFFWRLIPYSLRQKIKNSKII